MMKVYVSGSRLAWTDSGASVERSILGAIPDPVPSGFSGQQAGRVWVAQDHRDNALYYSDSTGTTRFIAGTFRGQTSTPDNGRVYLNTGLCTPTGHIWWTTPSASVSFRFSAAAEGYVTPPTIELIWVYNLLTQTASLVSNIPVPQNITVDGINFVQYLSDTNSTNQCGGTESPSAVPSLTISSGQFSATVGFPTTSGVLSYRIDSASMTLNNQSIIGGVNDPKCIGSSVAYLFVEPKGCVTVPQGSGDNPPRCDVACQEDSQCNPAADGCTKCSATSFDQVGVCYTPGFPPQGGGERPRPQCGQPCNVQDDLCPAECACFQGEEAITGACVGADF